MSTEISLNVVKATQDTLGQFVKKPPLTEKLLKKPPFRFLHDIIMTVLTTTGFFDGLFTEEEQISENVKDRDKKIAFLQKVIEVINIVTGSSLSVRPSKVIAGQEPENTNELLQKIGEALIKNLSSSQAVEKVLKKQLSKTDKNSKTISKNQKLDVRVPEKETKKKSEEKPTKAIAKSETLSKNKVSVTTKKMEENKESKLEKKMVESKNKMVKQNEKSKKRETSSTNFHKIENQNKTVEPVMKIPVKNELDDLIGADTSINSGDETLNEIENQNGISHVELDKRNNAVNENNQNIIEDTTLNNTSVHVHDSISDAQKNIDNQKLENESIPSFEESKEKVPTDINLMIIPKPEVKNDESSDKNLSQLRITSSKSDVKKYESSDKNLNQSRLTSSKPVKEKQTPFNNENSTTIYHNDENFSNNIEKTRPKTSLRPPTVRPSSSRPGAPRFKDSNVDIITNSTDNMPIAKVNIIIENYDNQPEDDDGSIIVEQVIDENIVDEKSFKSQINSNGTTHGHLVQQILETKKELDGESSKVEIEWEWGARREREASHKEVESLKNGLQSLSRAANPLGKLIDYVQEDVEIMRQELLHWKDARQMSANALIQQKSLTEKLIQPLESKLKQLNESIAEQMELIYTVKSNIQHNTKKIKKLIDKDEFKY